MGPLAKGIIELPIPTFAQGAVAQNTLSRGLAGPHSPDSPAQAVPSDSIGEGFPLPPHLPKETQ